MFIIDDPSARLFSVPQAVSGCPACRSPFSSFLAKTAHLPLRSPALPEFVSEEAEMRAPETLSHEYNWLEACPERTKETAAVCLTEMYGAAEQSYAKKSAAKRVRIYTEMLEPLNAGSKLYILLLGFIKLIGHKSSPFPCTSDCISQPFVILRFLIISSYTG